MPLELRVLAVSEHAESCWLGPQVALPISAISCWNGSCGLRSAGCAQWHFLSGQGCTSPRFGCAWGALFARKDIQGERLVAAQSCSTGGEQDAGDRHFRAAFMVTIAGGCGTRSRILWATSGHPFSTMRGALWPWRIPLALGPRISIMRKVKSPQASIRLERAVPRYMTRRDARSRESILWARESRVSLMRRVRWSPW
jgi:hypothetical protein